MKKQIKQTNNAILKRITIAIHSLIYIYPILGESASSYIFNTYIINLLITIILTTISIHDIDKMEVSNFTLKLSAAILFIFLIINPFNISYEQIKNHLIATITVFTFMSLLSIIGEKITQRTLLGNGDVKLFALGGALLGTSGSYAAIAMAFTTAALFSLIGRIFNRLKPWQAFPFAPFICISMQSVWILDKDWGIVEFFVR